MNKILLNTAYFPPVEYFAKLIGYDKVLIEADENYQKQSYRNRCLIMGPNDIQSLIVPVLKGKSKNHNIKSVKIDYSESWRNVHKRSIITAYRSSPFYDFYVDDILDVFDKKFIYLLDLNDYIINELLNIIGLETEFYKTEKYLKYPENLDDYRDKIHPKKNTPENNNFNPPEYFHVFNERFGFVPNLSILDLLFNKGPETLPYLNSAREGKL